MENTTRIIRIRIEKLFGVFNHEIDLHPSGITIIIGENGLGKTVLLELIEAFFKGKYANLLSVDFEKMSLTFSDGIIWEISKNNDPQTGEHLLVQQISGSKKIKRQILSRDIPNEEIDYFARKIARRSDDRFFRIGPNEWHDRVLGESVSTTDLLNRFEEFSGFIQTKKHEEPWYVSRHDKMHASLIETQRLITTDRREEKLHSRSVEKYSRELSQLIKSKLTESTEFSSKLDRTFPNRLINRIKKSIDITDDQLNQEYRRLEEKRKLLDRVGLIEIEKDSGNFENINDEKDVLRQVLWLYVEDSFEKIKIFDDISRKIELLLAIINKRFKHKKLFIDREEGFLFRSTIRQDQKDKKSPYQRIPVTKLSSGEQNELVLFYLLLFRTKTNSLILIDEPEVSLHISWQNCFIEDLKEIAKINNFDVIIATHSPDIISDNWYLKVELLGLE